MGIPLVLPVDHCRHGLERARNLIPRDETVMEPIGDVLARDAQRRAVLHERNVVDVRDLGATDPLAHPANHVAEDALRVILQLVLDLLLGQTTLPQKG